MAQFSQTSLDRIQTCDIRLQRLFKRVIKITDCSILTGHRDEVAQNAAFQEGHTKTLWPHSKHNRTPSLAVDVAPYPIDWEDRERFTYFAGVVMGVAAEQGLVLRWGGDWNRDFILVDNGFDDLVHFELMEGE